MKWEFIDSRGDGGNTSIMTNENTATDNRIIIERALSGLITDGDTATLDRLLRDDFVHHRPDRSRTKAEWLAALLALPLEDLRVELQHVLADGDRVAVISRRRLEGGGPGITGMDLWRLEDGLVVEGWEIIEPEGDAPANFAWWQPSGSSI